MPGMFGGGDVDTSSLQASQAQAAKLAKMQGGIGLTSYATQQAYQQPIYNEFMRILGFGTPTYGSPQTVKWGGQTYNLPGIPSFGYTGTGLPTPEQRAPWMTGVGKGMQPFLGSSGTPSSSFGYETPGTPYPSATGYPGEPTGSPGSSQFYMSPLESSLFQMPIFQSGQALDATMRQIQDSGLGPVQQQMLGAKAARERMTQLSTSAMQTTTNMINSILGRQDPSQQYLAGATSATGTSAQIAGQLAQLQAQSAASGAGLMGNIFSTIGTIGGFALGGPLGGSLGSLFGSGLAGNVTGSWGQAQNILGMG